MPPEPRLLGGCLCGGVRPSLRIFVGSKAPWYEITDPLPRHDTSPRGKAAKPA